MTAAVRKLETGGHGIPARLRAIADELEAASLPASSLGLLVIATVDAAAWTSIASASGRATCCARWGFWNSPRIKCCGGPKDEAR